MTTEKQPQDQAWTFRLKNSLEKQLCEDDASLHFQKEKNVQEEHLSSSLSKNLKITNLVTPGVLLSNKAAFIKNL